MHMRMGTYNAWKIHTQAVTLVLVRKLMVWDNILESFDGKSGLKQIAQGSRKFGSIDNAVLSGFKHSR